MFEIRSSPRWVPRFSDLIERAGSKVSSAGAPSVCLAGIISIEINHCSVAENHRIMAAPRADTNAPASPHAAPRVFNSSLIGWLAENLQAVIPSPL
jgi:hypothetical protein